MSGYSIGSLYNGDLHLFSAKQGKKPSSLRCIISLFSLAVFAAGLHSERRGRDG